MNDRFVRVVEQAVAAGFDPSRVPPSRPVVAVQGLGFVGAAMAIAVASARDTSSAPAYTVVGVDLADHAGSARIEALNAGRFPFETVDADLTRALLEARSAGNLVAVCEPEVYALAKVIVVDVPLDVDFRADPPALRLAGFEAAIRTVGRHVSPGALVLVETTVPPGTTEKVVVPLLAEELRARGLAPESVHVAHSYERVMPGAEYFASIVRFWRVYAGHTAEAAEAAEAFLRTVIDTEAFPLTRLASTTASETAKVMENTFRATTIALMDEWGEFAEAAGIDLFPIVDAIRVRPTHRNIRTPGFGVGGYCLTKDPLFGRLAAEAFFGRSLSFPFSTAAVRTNDRAPLGALAKVRALLGGSLVGKRVLLLGVSYRQDVGDTRYSPSETFARAALAEGATIVAHDPRLSFWDELGVEVLRDLPEAIGLDAVVLAVPHREYLTLDLVAWLGAARPVVLDGFGVLDETKRGALRGHGCKVASIGRGGEE